MPGKCMTEGERYKLEAMLEDKVPIPEIAKRLGRCRKTIYNEINRGTVELLDSELRKYKKYCADVSQRRYDEVKHNKGAKKKSGQTMRLPTGWNPK